VPVAAIDHTVMEHRDRRNTFTCSLQTRKQVFREGGIFLAEAQTKTVAATASRFPHSGGWGDATKGERCSPFVMDGSV